MTIASIEEHDMPAASAMQCAPSRVDTWANELHHQFIEFAQRVQGAKCWLLLDPATHDPASMLGISPFLLAESRPIAWQHANLAPAHRPYLVELALDQFSGDALLKASLQLAVDNWQPESSVQGAGHTVCGWLFSGNELPALSRHLGMHAVQSRSNDDGSTSRTLLRFWDPSTLPLLWEILDPLQRSILFGPVAAWSAIDRSGNLRTFELQDPEQFAQHEDRRRLLELREKQWLAVQNIGAMNAALIELAYQSDSASTAVIAKVQAALMRARAAGVHDLSDLKSFARAALQIDPAFDQHPRVREAMRALPALKFYRVAIGVLSAQDWETVRADCKALSRNPMNPDSQNDT